MLSFCMLSHNLQKPYELGPAFHFVADRSLGEVAKDSEPCWGASQSSKTPTPLPINCLNDKYQ